MEEAQERPMTNFQLYDGTYLDRGQEYEITLTMGPTKLRIIKLDSRKENISFIMNEGDRGVFRDMGWQEFSLGYQRGFIKTYDPLRIDKRLPPHKFT